MASGSPRHYWVNRLNKLNKQKGKQAKPAIKQLDNFGYVIAVKRKSITPSHLTYCLQLLNIFCLVFLLGSGPLLYYSSL